MQPFFLVKSGERKQRCRIYGSIIWMARNGSFKEEIKSFVEQEFQYDLSRTCDQSRTAVPLGGDCDTLICITGSMAEALYSIPEELKDACLNYIMEDINIVLSKFV